MSRLTKYLRQQCQWEELLRDSDGPVLNEFGEFQYKKPKTIKCRHESFCRDVQTANGSIMRVTSRYFVDNTTKVSVGDKLDNTAIITLSDYINSSGEPEGYEVYV